MNKQKTIVAVAAALAVAASLAVSAASAASHGLVMCLSCEPPGAASPAQTQTVQTRLRRVQAQVTVGTYTAKPASDYDARYVVRVDQLNLGEALVVLFRNSDDTPIWSKSVPVTPYATRPGGWLSVQTGILDCAGGANTAPNAYFRVQDGFSGRWSTPQYVTTGCSTL